MAVERWFEREASDLRGEAKNHLGRSPFSVGSGPIRLRVWPRRRSPPAAPPRWQWVPQSEDFPRRPKNFPFRDDEKAEEAPSPVFFRRVVNVLGAS